MTTYSKTLPMWSTADAASLLRLLAELDPRNRLIGEPEELLHKAETWANILTDDGIGRDWAEGWVRRHTPRSDERQLYLGDIRKAWTAQHTRDVQAEDRMVSLGDAVDEALIRLNQHVYRHDARIAGAAKEIGKRLPARSSASLTEAVQAARAGEPVPAPKGGDGCEAWSFEQALRDRAEYEADLAAEPPCTDPADIRARACGNRRLCACSHTKCRGGFLDGDQITVKNGRAYAAAIPCPHCDDAKRMVGESRPAPKGSRARHGARL